MDISEFMAENSGANNRGCGYHRLVEGDELDKGRKASLVAAFDNPAVQHSAIASVLVRWGFDVTADTVSRARRRKCRCNGG